MSTACTTGSGVSQGCSPFIYLLCDDSIVISLIEAKNKMQFGVSTSRRSFNEHVMIRYADDKTMVSV